MNFPSAAMPLQYLYLVEVYDHDRVTGVRTSVIMRIPYFDELEASVKADTLERAGWDVCVARFVREDAWTQPSSNGGPAQ